MGMGVVVHDDDGDGSGRAASSGGERLFGYADGRSRRQSGYVGERSPGAARGPMRRGNRAGTLSQDGPRGPPRLPASGRPDAHAGWAGSIGAMTWPCRPCCWSVQLAGAAATVAGHHSPTKHLGPADWVLLVVGPLALVFRRRWPVGGAVGGVRGDPHALGGVVGQSQPHRGVLPRRHLRPPPCRLGGDRDRLPLLGVAGPAGIRQSGGVAHLRPGVGRMAGRTGDRRRGRPPAPGAHRRDQGHPSA